MTTFPNNLCADCHANVHVIKEYAYMLKDALWDVLGRPVFLCVSCIESRLGRGLTAADFNWEIPLNTISSGRRSKRLTLRMQSKRKVVAFLQNAWSPLYAGGTWPRESWLKALKASRSGCRLRALEQTAVGVNIWYDNTTPEVGDNPDSLLPPDLKHITRVLEEQRPDFVVSLGKQAAKVLAGWPNLLVLPHPAHRLLTDRLYAGAGRILRAGFTNVIELKQLRGRYRRVAKDYLEYAAEVGPWKT